MRNRSVYQWKKGANKTDIRMIDSDCTNRQAECKINEYEFRDKRKKNPRSSNYFLGGNATN